MCGIVGIAGNINHQHKKIFRDMLIFDQVRGLDSTGVASIPLNDDNPIVLVKDVASPVELAEFNRKEFDDKAILRDTSKCLIGHNRAATIGIVNQDNAHPFQFDHIVGAHNGSLTDWFDLEGWKDFDVDSKAIFKTIADKGIDHCWANFTGAAALAWFDRSRDGGSLNLIRNKERPLHIIKNEAGDVLFFASESWMIHAAVARSSVKLEKTNKSEKTIKEVLLKENTLHRFKVESNKISLEEVRELETKKFYAITTPRTGTTSSRISRGGVSRKKTQINKGWAKKLEKAPKGIRGTVVNFKKAWFMEIADNHTVAKDNVRSYIVCHTKKDDEVVHIIPNCKYDFEYLKTYIKINKDFIMTGRARYRDFDMHGSTNKKVLAISSQHINPVAVAVDKKEDRSHLLSSQTQKVVPFCKDIQIKNDGGGQDNDKSSDVREYHSYGDTKISELVWNHRINELYVKGCCHWCNNPLTIEEHKEYEWLSLKEVLCGSCKQDPERHFYMTEFLQ